MPNIYYLFSHLTFLTILLNIIIIPTSLIRKKLMLPEVKGLAQGRSWQGIALVYV